MRFDLGTDFRHNGLRPGSLVFIVVVDVVRSIQAEQQGDVRIRERFVQERPLVQQGTQTVQGTAMEHVDGTQHADKAFLHALVWVLSEHLDQVVELMECRSNVRRRRIGPSGHGASPLP